MRRCEAWLRFSGNDVAAVWKRVVSCLNLGHANVLPMIKPGICRLPTRADGPSSDRYQVNNAYLPILWKCD